MKYLTERVGRIAEDFESLRRNFPKVSDAALSTLVLAGVLDRELFGDSFGHEICMALKVAMRDESLSINANVNSEE